LISRFRTADTGETVETKSNLDWENPDNVRLTFDGLDGKPATIYYKRLDSAYDQSKVVDPK
jgi:hypothetical protein